MSPSRFSLLHLLLGVAFVGLLLGLLTPLWRVASRPPPLVIDHFAISPDGKHLAAHYSHQLVRVWSIGPQGPRLVREVVPATYSHYLGQPEHGGIFFRDDQHVLWIEAGDMFRSPKGRGITAGSFQYGPQTVLHELDLVSGKAAEIGRLNLNYDLARRNAISDTHLILNGDAIDLGTGQLTKNLGKQIEDIVASADRGTVAVAALDPKIRYPATWDIEILDAATLQAKCQVKIARDNRNGQWVISRDGTWAPNPMVYPPTRGAWQLSPDGSLLIIASHNQIVSINPRTAEQDVLQTHVGGPLWLAISSDGRRVAVGNFVAVEFYDLTAKTLVKRFTDAEFLGPRDITFERDELWSRDHGYPLRNFALSPDGIRFLAFSGDRIYAYDTSRGELVYEIPGREPAPAVLAPMLASVFGLIIWAVAAAMVRYRARHSPTNSQLRTNS